MGSDYQGFGLFNVNLKVNWPKKKIKKKNQYSQPPLWPNAKKLVTLEILQNFLSSPDSEFTKNLTRITLSNDERNSAKHKQPIQTFYV